MNKMNATIGSVALTAAFVLMPFAASAATVNASSSTGIIISPNGIVRVIGADVTAVGNGFINAATTIGNTVLNWLVNISATTKVSGNGTVNASTTGISVGDRLAFKGALTSTSSSPFVVAATKIRDITTILPFKHVTGGKISSVNSANGSFVITKGDRSITVQTNASTTIMVNGTATTTLASLQAGDEVKVSGTPNADGSVITATKVVVHESDDKSKGDDDNDGNRGKGKDKDHEVNARAELRANENASFKDGHEGKGKGLNLFGGLGFGLGKDD